MPTLKYKDGSTWKELSIGGGAVYNGANVNIIGNANATVTYTNSTGKDSGTVKLNNEGLGSAIIATNDTYTFKDASNNMSATISVETSYTVYLKNVIGVSIDTTNSDPTAAVTYIGGATGKTPGWDTWKDTAWFKDLKPCVIDGKTFEVKYYLDKNNYTKKADGTASKLDGADGYVMLEVPRMGVKFETVGTKQNIYLTTDPNAPGFQYYAHSLNSENDCSKIYIGVYLTSFLNNSSYQSNYITGVGVGSFSGKFFGDNASGVPRIEPYLWYNTYYKTATTQIQSMPYHVWQLLLVLFTIVFKTLNCKTVFPTARSNTTMTTAVTGTTNGDPMCSTNAQPAIFGIKCLGLEDLWGGYQVWSQGFFVEGGGRAISLNYNNTFPRTYNESVYNANFLYPVNLTSQTKPNGFFSLAYGDNLLEFCPKETKGSSTTYYCTNAYIQNFSEGSHLQVGGQSGLFYYNATMNWSNGTYTAASRMVIKKVG